VGNSGENIRALKRHLFSRFRPGLGFNGIKVIRFKRNIENDRLRLRLLKISDLYVLRSRYQSEHFHGNRAREARPFSSLFSLWRWLTSSFQAFYLIEIKLPAACCGVSKRNSPKQPAFAPKSYGAFTSPFIPVASYRVFWRRRIKAVGTDRMIGFVGLYNLEIGQRLYLSAVLFDPEDRRQGYGRQALTLLFNFLKEAGVIREVRAQVFRSNVASLAFLHTLGFEVLVDQGDQLLLVKALDQKH
jgi:ribosomal protein S18 acetylase RimI-like enzyme